MLWIFPQSSMTILKRPPKSKKTILLTIIITTFATTLIIGGFALQQLATIRPVFRVDSVPPLPLATTTTQTSASGGECIASSTTPSLKLFVASRRGKTYYYPWCSGAVSIPEANRIWFQSTTAAAIAGYTPAKSCKDLFP